MFDRFAAARLKVERAEKHIADLERIVTSLPSLDFPTVETDVNSGYKIVKHFVPDMEKIAVDMALIIGDAIHNLRVGLEYVYLGAIERHAPTILDEHTRFPSDTTLGKSLKRRLEGDR